MSHLTCPKCGGNEHYAGYGFAGGFFGAYTICDCGALLEGFADVRDLDDERAAQQIAHVKALLKETWGDRQAASASAPDPT
jgi:hypothetical protein